MGKQTNIRWRKSDEQELRRLVKNYNNNISRRRNKLIDSGHRYQAAQLPQKVSYKELRSSIETRSDFNSTVRQMENFNKTGIKYTVDANTEKSLTATVRDFNRKVTKLSREAKTQADKAMLPDKISADYLLKNSSSKEALKANIKIFKGFLEKGAEEAIQLDDTKFNIKMTKWQKETMETMLTGINDRREAELQMWKDMEVKYGGRSAGYTQGQVRMDDGDFDDFKPMNLYNYSSTYTDMQAKFRLMIRENQEGYWDARTELARINYTEKFESLLGNDELGKYLLKHIRGMDLKDFKRVLKSEDDLFLLLYELERSQSADTYSRYEQIVEEIWNEWIPDEDMYDVLNQIIERKTGGH